MSFSSISRPFLAHMERQHLVRLARNFGTQNTKSTHRNHTSSNTKASTILAGALGLSTGIYVSSQYAERFVYERHDG